MSQIGFIVAAIIEPVHVRRYKLPCDQGATMLSRATHAPKRRVRIAHALAVGRWRSLSAHETLGGATETCRRRHIKTRRQYDIQFVALKTRTSGIGIIEFARADHAPRSFGFGPANGPFTPRRRTKSNAAGGWVANMSAPVIGQLNGMGHPASFPPRLRRPSFRSVRYESPRPIGGRDSNRV